MQNGAYNPLWSASEINKYSAYKIYKYSKDYYKLIIYKYINNYDRTNIDDEDLEPIFEDKILEDLKLSNNVYRAKSLIFQYAMCNDWDYFVTLTIDGKKFDRTNIKLFMKILTKWLADYQRYHGKIKYVLIPELHADQTNWHLHGLIKFENYVELLTKQKIEEVLNSKVSVRLTYFKPSRYKNNGRKLWAKDNNEKFYLNWEEYEDKFGINVFAKIRNKEAVSSYITKYITKSLFQFNEDGKKILNRIAVGQNLYYCSNGLAKREVVESGRALEDKIVRFASPGPDNDFTFFENEYMIIKKMTVSAYEEAKKQIRECIEAEIQENKNIQNKRLRQAVNDTQIKI